MTLVYSLSRPVDLTPFLDAPSPIELWPFEEPSLFERLSAGLSERLSDCPPLVIDGCRPPVFAKANQSMDVVHLPTERLFSRIFITSALLQSAGYPSTALLLPGNLEIADFDHFCESIRLLGPLNPGLLLIAGGESPYWLEGGENLEKKKKLEIQTMKRFRSMGDVLRYREANPDQPCPYLQWSGALMWNVMEFPRMLSEQNPLWGDLFYMVVEAWKDPRSIGTVIGAVIEELSETSFTGWAEKVEEKALVALEGLSSISGPRAYLKRLPHDEAGNFILGEASLSGTTDSLILNDGALCSLQNLSGIALCARDHSVSIRPIDSL